MKGANILETLSEVKTVVFDKTGTLTQGVFEVKSYHDASDRDATAGRERMLEYAAVAESASSHPIARSLLQAYGRPVDRSRLTDLREISGEGITAVVDGTAVAVGNKN